MPKRRTCGSPGSSSSGLDRTLVLQDRYLGCAGGWWQVGSECDLRYAFESFNAKTTDARVDGSLDEGRAVSSSAWLRKIDPCESLRGCTPDRRRGRGSCEEWSTKHGETNLFKKSVSAERTVVVNSVASALNAKSQPSPASGLGELHVLFTSDSNTLPQSSKF